MEGRFNGGFFALQVWGGLYLEGLTDGGANFRNFTVFLALPIILLIYPQNTLYEH